MLLAEIKSSALSTNPEASPSRIAALGLEK